MSGETNLTTLIRSMTPTLDKQPYVFCCVDKNLLSEVADWEVKALFMEDEGMTLVIPESQAIHRQIAFEMSYQCITLNVHSSLEAVGLTAAFSAALSNQGISANVIAGYYHDHIFIQTKHALHGVQTLKALAAS